jgi:hypothetical protein
MKAETILPEVTLLYDAREARPENAVGVGDFWYEPEVWSLPLSPASKVLYAGLCSYLGHGQINRKDLRGTLKNSSDEETAGALEDLVCHGLLVSAGEVVSSSGLSAYKVRSVKGFAS